MDDLEILILSEVSQRIINIIWYHLYVKFKSGTDELIYKTETLTDIGNLWLPKGKGGVGG